MNTSKINKFITDYKPVNIDKLEVNKKSIDILNREQKIKIINNILKNINYLIAIFENDKIEYILY